MPACKQRTGFCRSRTCNFLLIGGSPIAGNFLLRRQKKVTKEKATPVRRLPLRASAKSGAAQLARSALRQCELRTPDSDSRSVEREGAQAVARGIVKRGAIAAAPAPQASLTVSRQPPFLSSSLGGSQGEKPKTLMLIHVA